MRRWAPAGLLLCTLLSACTWAGWPMADRGGGGGGDVLVSFESEVDGAPTGGLRVHDDGRTEIMDRGPAADRPGELAWRLAWEYDDAALAGVRDAVAEAADAGLEERYEPNGGESHPTIATWRLQGADGAVQTVVVFSPHPGAPPQLKRLYRQLLALRPQAAGTSVWRVRVGQELVERQVDGEPAGVGAIAPLVRALFARSGNGGSELPADADAPLLVEIEWSTDGTRTETTRVYADGRNVSVKGGAEEEQPRYGAADVAAIEDAIEQVGWAALPDPLVPS